MSEGTYSMVCGVSCKPQGKNCNGYCVGKAKSPCSYDAPAWAIFSKQEKALLSIIKSSPIADAPTKIVHNGQWFEILIGVGSGYTARILIDADTLRELELRHENRHLPPDCATIHGMPAKVEAA